MNSIFNTAHKQSAQLREALDQVSATALTSSPAEQGQVAASLASFSRNVDEYANLAKSELNPAKQEKAQERVKNFRKEISEYKQQLERVKAERAEAEASSGRSELLGRRGHSSATPDNPYAYNASVTQRSGPENPFGSNIPPSTLRRQEHALMEQDFSSRAHESIDGFIDQGRMALDNLLQQREILKGTQRKLYSAANTLGVSRDTIRMVERRAKQDKWLFGLGVVIFFAFCYMVLRFFG